MSAGVMFALTPSSCLQWQHPLHSFFAARAGGNPAAKESFARASDESEFRPALAARDGKPFEPDVIPDGFYGVGDTENPQLAFQQAVIAAVAKVTHIAPADGNGEIIGSPVVAPGVILYPFKQLGLCAGVTNARYTTTTEVYPDSPRATPEQCNAAQVVAVCAAIDFALAHGGYGGRAS